MVVIEDEDALRSLVADGLVDAGFRVLAAKTAGEGIALCVMHRPDVVVVDHALAELDGLVVCTHLRADVDTRHSGIVLMSSGHAAMAAAREAGADATFAKPFAIGELVDRVRALADDVRAAV